MKNIYYFLAGALIAFVLLREWQPPIHRYEVSFSKTDETPIKLDTATGKLWILVAEGWLEMGKPLPVKK